MVKSLWFLIFILIEIHDTIYIGRINNSAYISSNTSTILLYNMTCDECICYTFFSNNLLNYTGLNCYTNNNTCLLFTNYLSLSMIKININSIFIFQHLDTTQTTNNNMVVSTTVRPTTVTPNSITTAVQCYQPEWNSTGIVLASYGTNLSQVNHVYGLFIAANSDVLYMADSDNHRVLKWLPGATSGILVAGGQGPGWNTTQLNGPIEVCVDTNENVYVADSGNYRVQYFNNGSSIGLSIIGNQTNNAVNNPLGNIFGLGVDLAKNVYITEYDKDRATKWSPNAISGILVAGNGTPGISIYQLYTPTAFYTDPITGALYIPNQNSHCITKWLPGNLYGIVVAGTCGIPGTNTTLLATPTCVTMDRYGNMYVTDTVNGGRVLMFCPNSLIGIPIVTSGLNYPISIAVDTQLNLYVSDWSNNRIVKYSVLY